MDKVDFPLVDVLRVRPLDGNKLWLLFSNGFEGTRDVSDILSSSGAMVQPLLDAQFFDKVFIEMGAPTWPNGFDLDPINLFMELRDATLLKPANANAAD